MQQIETLDPSKLGLARRKRRKRSHADAKNRLYHHRKAGVAAYIVPLKTADLSGLVALAKEDLSHGGGYQGGARSSFGGSNCGEYHHS